MNVEDKAQIKKELSNIKSIVKSYAYEQGEPLSSIKSLLQILPSLQLEDLNETELFSLWDALGSEGARSEVGEKIYQAVGSVWQKSIQEEDLVEVYKFALLTFDRLRVQIETASPKARMALYA